MIVNPFAPSGNGSSGIQQEGQRTIIEGILIDP